MFVIMLVAAVVAFACQFNITVTYCVLIFALPVLLPIFFKSEGRIKTDKSAIYVLALLTIVISAGFFVLTVFWYEGSSGTRSLFLIQIVLSGFLGAVIGLFIAPYNVFTFVMLNLVLEAWESMFGTSNDECENQVG